MSKNCFRRAIDLHPAPLFFLNHRLPSAESRLKIEVPLTFSFLCFP